MGVLVISIVGTIMVFQLIRRNTGSAGIVHSFTCNTDIGQVRKGDLFHFSIFLDGNGIDGNYKRQSYSSTPNDTLLKRMYT